MFDIKPVGAVIHRHHRPRRQDAHRSVPAEILRRDRRADQRLHLRRTAGVLLRGRVLRADTARQRPDHQGGAKGFLHGFTSLAAEIAAVRGLRDALDIESPRHMAQDCRKF
jgi:hypothetical protein